DAIDSHLRPTFVIHDGKREVARGSDLDELRTELAPKVRQKLNRSASRITASGQTAWTFGTIPTTVELGPGVIGYPGLVHEGSTVGVAVAETPARALRQHELGLRRLLVGTNPSPVRPGVAPSANNTNPPPSASAGCGGCWCAPTPLPCAPSWRTCPTPTNSPSAPASTPPFRTCWPTHG